MPVLIMSKLSIKLDNQVRAKAMTFLQKLAEDDALPGLHVEPINDAVDSRVRTGRVDQFWRAVMFRLDGDETHYVIDGVWPHDEAIVRAKRARLRVNPVNGIPEIEETPIPDERLWPDQEWTNVQPEPEPEPPVVEQPVAEPPTAEPKDTRPLLVRLGRTREELIERLGVSEAVADRALAAADEDALLALAGEHEGWLGNALVDLGAGESVDAIVERLQLAKPTNSGDDDQDIIDALDTPAAKGEFVFIGDQDELKRVIESGDFGAWRIFLHPEQRKYVERSWHGPFRLSGGAGTGKTVVLVHRARAMWRRNPSACIVLTTFNVNLAQMLRDSLTQLDPTIPQARRLGERGVFVGGIDALASAVLRTAGPRVGEATETVLGDRRSSVSGRTPRERWNSILEGAQAELPVEIANDSFLHAEYELVVLPNRVTTEADYLRVRRPGRGVALDRGKRLAVWALIEAYRASGRVDTSVDFAEAAAVAAACLEAEPAQHLADHVLVDEGQDFLPSHWQLLRALVAPGDNDIFIAEDSHQRIYGSRLVLGRYGIKIVGRAQRLTLNYRTTAQNLRYAMTILEGGDYVDLEDQPEATGYRSVRLGPEPDIRDLPSLTTELDTITDRVRTWIDDGAAPETVAVLVQDQRTRDRVVSRLTEFGLPARAVDREAPPTDRVQVMTMHRAKGMEFSRVILADVGYISPKQAERHDQLDPADRADADLRLRSLIYVAATRARDELVVLQRRV